jgi:hypothetical protein
VRARVRACGGGWAGGAQAQRGELVWVVEEDECTGPRGWVRGKSGLWLPRQYLVFQRAWELARQLPPQAPPPPQAAEAVHAQHHRRAAQQAARLTRRTDKHARELSALLLGAPAATAAPDASQQQGDRHH